MDDIVKQAIAKWPKVPHCYGWLALDARGNWRMRDERAQQLQLAGDPLRQPALLGFINRNYAADERGCWFFQNGPQRVYVNLEAAPFIARTEPRHGLVLHTGEAVAALQGAWLSDQGVLLVLADGKLAQVDDRDMAQMMGALRLEGAAVSDEQLMAWLDGAAGQLSLEYGDAAVKVERIDSTGVAQRFGFVRTPSPA